MKRIKAKEFVEKLHEEIETINFHVPKINYGGCGVFAFHLYELLTRFNYKPKLVLIGNRKWDAVVNVNYIVQNNVEFYRAVFDHVMIYVGEYYIDSKGIYKNFRYSDYKVYRRRGWEMAKGLDVELLKEWLTERGWNTKFKRETGEPLIMKRLEIAEKNMLNYLTSVE